MPDLPHFNNPPVVERIISAQFLPVQQFSSIYGGWFSKQYLESVRPWDNVVSSCIPYHYPQLSPMLR